MNKENPDYRKDDNEISAQKLCAGTMSIVCNQTYRAGGLLIAANFFKLRTGLRCYKGSPAINYIAVQKRDYTGFFRKTHLYSAFIPGALNESCFIEKQNHLVHERHEKHEQTKARSILSKWDKN